MHFFAVFCALAFVPAYSRGNPIDAIQGLVYRLLGKDYVNHDTYRDLCDEVQETMLETSRETYRDEIQETEWASGWVGESRLVSHGGKIRRVSYVRSLRRHQLPSQLLNKPNKAEIKLIDAINDGCYDKVLALIGDGADVRYADRLGRTPLHFAVTAGYNNIVKLLIANGAAVDAVDSIGNTPLHLAVSTNQVGIVTTLLGSGADISFTDGDGQTPLHLANSRLRSLHTDHDTLKAVPNKIKKEVIQVVEMLKAYFERTRCEKSTTDELETLASKLSISESVEEVDEVQGLLQHFTSMSLKKETPAVTGGSNICIAREFIIKQ